MRPSLIALILGWCLLPSELIAQAPRKHQLKLSLANYSYAWAHLGYERSLNHTLSLEVSAGFFRDSEQSYQNSHQQDTLNGWQQFGTAFVKGLVYGLFGIDPPPYGVRFVEANQRGIFLRFGPRFYVPIRLRNISPRRRYRKRDLMEGFYVKPEIFLHLYRYDQVRIFTDTVQLEGGRRVDIESVQVFSDQKKQSILLLSTFGYQWVWWRRLSLDIGFGFGAIVAPTKADRLRQTQYGRGTSYAEDHTRSFRSNLEVKMGWVF